MLRFPKENTTAAPQGAVAQVSYSEGGSYGVVGAAEQRALPLFGPHGIDYRPAEGDRLLLLPAEGGNVCAGVLSRAAEDLAAGELRLRSEGGAEIRLCADGSVVINGVTITREGQIIQK